MYLLGEELRRIPATFRYRSKQWLSAATGVPADERLEPYDEQTRMGYRSYAIKQAAVYYRLAEDSEALYKAENPVQPPRRTDEPGLDGSGDGDVEMAEA